MPDQVALMKAISLELARQGHRDVNVRQFNAVIEAATLLCDALAAPHLPAEPGMGLTAWLACDETGVSSLAMARRLAPLAGFRDHVTGWRQDHPLDPSDFGRCLGLLDAVPELRPHLPAMADVSPAWARLVTHWEELEALYRAEAPSGQAPKLYRRIQELTTTPEAPCAP